MADVRLAAIVSLLDEVESRISDHVGQATVLVDEADLVGNLMKGNLVQVERVRGLLQQTARLRESVVQQRAILAELRQRMRILRSHSS